MRIFFVYNLNPFNNLDIEWDNLKSHIKEYTKIHRTNGWENLFLNEIIDNASNPHKIYYLVIPKRLNHMMYHMHNQIFFVKNLFFQRTKEFITNKKFSLHMG
jgi:hypothetical protein